MSRPLISDWDCAYHLRLMHADRPRRLAAGDCACRQPEMDGIHDLFRCEAKTINARTGAVDYEVIAERWEAPRL